MFQLPNGSEAVYCGEFSAGTRCGLGVMIIERSGEQYAGPMSDGKPSGAGWQLGYNEHVLHVQ